MEIDWFWLTVIVAIVAICVNSTLCHYFSSKYGDKDDEGGEE